MLADLVELAPGGVEEEAGDGWVEYAIYGAPGELPGLPDLEAAVADGLVEVTSKDIPDDWADRWQDFHEPVLVGDRILVRPSWAEPQDGTIDLVVDPGQAFGTGAHPTTRMCLELLLELSERGEAAGPPSRPAPRAATRGLHRHGEPDRADPARRGRPRRGNTRAVDLLGPARLRAG